MQALLCARYRMHLSQMARLVDHSVQDETNPLSMKTGAGVRGLHARHYDYYYYYY